jgi:flagellar protein FliJ
MKSFLFPLEKVLQWRRAQLDIEEARYKRELAALAALDMHRDALRESARRAEAHVRELKGVTGQDLAALAEFRLHVLARMKELELRRAEQSKKIAVQQTAMLEASRRCRLLERLRERRLEEWREAENRELEELASESYLANWNRSAAKPTIHEAA